MKWRQCAVIGCFFFEPLVAQERVWERDLIDSLSEFQTRHFRAMDSPRTLTLSEARHAQELRNTTYTELHLLMSAADEIKTTRREMLHLSMARFYRHVESDVVRRRWEALRTVLLKDVPVHLMAAEILWREGAKNWAANIPPKRKNRRDFPHFFRDEEGRRVEYVAPVLGYQDYLEFSRYAQRLNCEWIWMKKLRHELSEMRNAVHLAWQK